MRKNIIKSKHNPASIDFDNSNMNHNGFNPEVE